jgi:site-specific DNA-methyltransferase (adenine-specific)
MTGKVYLADSRKLGRIEDEAVALSVTSPPYTRVIRYGSFNWIRLWFLGYDAKEVDDDLFCSQSMNNYRQFMEDTLRENWRVLKKGGVAVYVIGDVKKRETDDVDNLAKFVWEECAQKVGFSLLEPIQIDSILDNTKVSKIWGEKRGNATKIDRVLIMRK